MKKTAILVLVIFAFTVGFSCLNARVTTKNGETRCEKIKKHPFSVPDKDDTFKLIYNCDNLEDSMYFQIVSFSGDLIFGKKFTGKAFYDYGRPWYVYVSDSKRGRDMNVIAQNLSRQVSDSLHRADIQYIKDRIDDFFNEREFVANPLSKLDIKHLDETHFEGIEGDPTAVGFKYRLFDEGFEMIAYSKKMQKVQLIVSTD
jgi:hypothetical protein